eukprot:14888137-Ditylum_brightwellii.AAC.1
MYEQEVDIWGWADTNANWSLQMVSKAKYMGNQIYNHFTFMASLSDDPADFYQQGCTCIEITNKMTGRIFEVDHDNNGIRQWSYAKVAGQDQYQITAITAYCPCK